MMISVNTGQTVLMIIAIVFLGTNVFSMNPTIKQHRVLYRNSHPNTLKLAENATP